MTETKMNVLIVEDDYIIYEELAEFFEEKGFAVMNENGVAVDCYDAVLAVIAKMGRPDLAVLDIEIKGPLDGLQLGKRLKEKYGMPLIYLTREATDENVDQSIAIRAERFIPKRGMYKEQLWINVRQLQPLIAASVKTPEQVFWKVKEIDARSLEPGRKPEEQQFPEPLDTERLIRWKEVKFIGTFNSSTVAGKNNNLILYTTLQHKAWIIRGNMKDILPHLNRRFVQVNQSEIVNYDFLTDASGRSGLVHMDGKSFRISDTYKSQALQRFRELVSVETA